MSNDSWKYQSVNPCVMQNLIIVIAIVKLYLSRLYFSRIRSESENVRKSYRIFTIWHIFVIVQSCSTINLFSKIIYCTKRSWNIYKPSRQDSNNSIRNFDRATLQGYSVKFSLANQILCQFKRATHENRTSTDNLKQSENNCVLQHEETAKPRKTRKKITLDCIKRGRWNGEKVIP